ncbi:hypothetical protein HanRHA438_Chr03g0147061 [Helianthus annuus]|nr:hypothetical protein HanOQP8_Chr03g0124691 [Helianthus annuus]KAJ0937900.1 hypothetical protein HanRHA438_Chr03g0147061 [Helianthus annuus]
MASSSSSPLIHPLLSNNTRISSRHASTCNFSSRRPLNKLKSTITAMAQPQRSAMQYNQVGDSNLVVSEITFGTVSFFLNYLNCVLVNLVSALLIVCYICF